MVKLYSLLWKNSFILALLLNILKINEERKWEISVSFFQSLGTYPDHHDISEIECGLLVTSANSLGTHSCVRSEAIGLWLFSLCKCSLTWSCSMEGKFPCFPILPAGQSLRGGISCRLMACCMQAESWFGLMSSVSLHQFFERNMGCVGSPLLWTLINRDSPFALATGQRGTWSASNQTQKNSKWDLRICKIQHFLKGLSCGKQTLGFFSLLYLNYQVIDLGICLAQLQHSTGVHLPLQRNQGAVNVWDPKKGCKRLGEQALDRMNFMLRAWDAASPTERYFWFA